MTLDITELISKTPLFADADHEKLIKLLSDCKIKEFSPGSHLCKEGEYHEECGIIITGTAIVKIPLASSGKTKEIALGSGEIFGEVAVLSGNPRTANIEATTQVTLLSISRKILFKIIDKFPSVKSKIDEQYRQKALTSHLLKCSLFSGIPNHLMEELTDKVTLHSYEKGAVVFNQGDEADSLFLVRYGFVKVSQDAGGKERVLAYLKDGHFFGEIGLLQDGEKRMATLSAINRAELLKISKTDFNTMVLAHPSIKVNIEKIIEQRKQRNIEIMNDSQLESALKSAIDHGIIQTKAILVMDSTKCVQCDICIKACAALHDNTPRLVRKGIKLNNFLLIPSSCRHCDDPTCMSKCPTGAITRDTEGEIYHQDFCIGCGNCARNCPYGNISIVELPDVNEETSGFFSRFFSSFKTEDRSNEAEVETNSPFKGDRDLVNRAPSEKLPGDRNLVQRSAEANTPQKKKKKTQKRAVKCDMCRDYDFMGCVYNCPKGAARRVDPTEYFIELNTIG